MSSVTHFLLKKTRNGWSDEGLVTLLDLALRTPAWGAVCVYLRPQLFNPGRPKIHVNLHVQYLVSDVVSVVTGLFLCYVGGFWKNEGEDAILEEPLFECILTFSWVGSLISVGNKKTLDLEDIPRLDPSDSVFVSFPSFRNKLEAECGTINGVTTLRLVKALVSSAWKDILFSALFVMMYTLASYVGPYLIDNFVQYLNGRRKFKNEG
ncbi:hypothetical protein CMV_026895 [Castanea mollissima]|uniref:Uncharacterized protein n=1 Tax=Castanea mollissima TaxID=60419 RepID=A0A8J4QJ61_9ROSI|nr:hypothetical protein CMV_026895 [Castanea mollissima]